MIVLINLIWILLIPALYAEEATLPIFFNENSNKGVLKIENNGKCPFYNLKISTLPPDRKDFAGFVSTLTARYMGLNSFITTIEILKENESKTIKKSELMNSEGKKLNDDYNIGMWVIETSYCGHDKTVEFPSE